MLSKSELSIIETYAKISAGIYSLGLGWNSNFKLLTPTTTATNKLKHLANILLQFFGCLIIWNSMNRIHGCVANSVPGVGIVSKVIYIFLCLTEVGLFLANFIFSCRREELVALFNQMLVFSRKGAVTGNKDGETLNTKRSRNLRYWHYAYLMSGTSAGIVITLIEVHYILKILHVEPSNPRTFISIMILTFWFVPSAVIVGLLQVNLIHYYVLISEGLRVDPQVDDNEASSTILVIRRHLHQYNCLRLLCDFFNCTFSKELIPVIKYIGSLAGMMCFFLAVRMKNIQLDWIIKIGMNLVFINLVIYTWAFVNLGASLMSSFWSRSIGYIDNIKELSNDKASDNDESKAGTRSGAITKKGKKEVKACIKSLPLLRFNVGGIYYMEKEAKLTLIAFLINGTLNLLLAFP